MLLEELLENVAGVDPVVKGKDGVHLPVSLEKRNICKESKRLASSEHDLTLGKRMIKQQKAKNRLCDLAQYSL